MRAEHIELLKRNCIRVQIPLQGTMLRHESLAVLDVELNEFSEIVCLGYYRLGDANINQFVFLDAVPPAELADSEFFKYVILGSNRFICYYADHERGLFNLPKDRMIETMSQPYYPKELAIKMPNLDMVSSKYLPRFEPSTAHNIACHNAGCILKILLLYLGNTSFNRIDFPLKFQRFMDQNVGGLDVGIPFSPLFTETSLTVIEFVLSPDKSEVEYVCYFDFQSTFIRIVRMGIGLDEFEQTEIWDAIKHTPHFTSVNLDLMRCILHLPPHRFTPIPLHSYSKIDEFLSIKGLNGSGKGVTGFDRLYYAYSQVVKAVMVILLGQECCNLHFKRNYYRTFSQAMISLHFIESSSKLEGSLWRTCRA